MSARTIALSLPLIASFLLQACTPNPTSNAPRDPIPTISGNDPLTQSGLGEKDYARRLPLLSDHSLSELLNSETNRREYLLDQHSDYALAQHARALELDQDPTIAALIEESTRSILIKALVEQTREAVELPNEEDLERLAKQKYQRESEKYLQPEARKVAHILIAESTANCEHQDQTQEERLARVQERLSEGDAFSTLAMEYSDDPRTAGAGGDISTSVKRDGDFVKPFERAVFALESVGDVSEPIQTKFGLHLIKLLEIEPEHALQFEQIRDGLVLAERNAILLSAVEKMRSRAYPDVKNLDLHTLAELIKIELQRREK